MTRNINLSDANAGAVRRTHFGAMPASTDVDAILETVDRIVSEVVRPSADAVDREARFPSESIAALRDAGLLAAAVPSAFGGLGCTVPALSRICTALARGCASTAMVVAMHYGQVYMLARHAGPSDRIREFLRSAAKHQLLVASATSEVGAEVGTSKAAIARFGEKVCFDKRCSVLSYAEHTDAILATARRTPEAAPADQSFVLLMKGDFELRDVGSWNALGMRGTCSPPVTLHADCSAEQVLPFSYRDVAQRSMVPISNILWSSAWLGIAEAAFDIARARALMLDRSLTMGLPLGSRRLSRAALALQMMQNNIAVTAQACEDFGSLAPSGSEDELVEQIVRTNNLKISSSEAVWQVCHDCLAVCGVAGYLTEGRFSLGRHLRDSLSAALMLGNDRIEATNAALLLLQADG